MSSRPQTVPSDSQSYNLEPAISCHTRPSTRGAEGSIEDAYHQHGLGLCRIFERGIGSAASQKRGHFCRDVRPGEVSAGVIGGQPAAQAGFPILVSCKRNHFRKAGTAHLWVWTESVRFKTDAPTLHNDRKGSNVCAEADCHRAFSYGHYDVSSFLRAPSTVATQVPAILIRVVA